MCGHIEKSVNYRNEVLSLQSFLYLDAVQQASASLQKLCELSTMAFQPNIHPFLYYSASLLIVELSHCHLPSQTPFHRFI